MLCQDFLVLKLILVHMLEMRRSMRVLENVSGEVLEEVLEAVLGGEGRFANNCYFAQRSILGSLGAGISIIRYCCARQRNGNSIH